MRGPGEGGHHPARVGGLRGEPIAVAVSLTACALALLGRTLALADPALAGARTLRRRGGGDPIEHLLQEHPDEDRDHAGGRDEERVVGDRVRDERGRWYVSHCGWYQGGLYLAPLEWRDGQDEDDTSMPVPD